jgi:hypothetical protein
VWWYEAGGTYQTPGVCQITGERQLEAPPEFLSYQERQVRGLVSSVTAAVSNVVPPTSASSCTIFGSMTCGVAAQAQSQASPGDGSSGGGGNAANPTTTFRKKR